MVQLKLVIIKRNNMKTMSCSVATLIVGLLLTGVPNARAGAYDTGEGQGYASCASEERIYNGTIISIVRVFPDDRPAFYGVMVQLQCSILLRAVFALNAYYLPGREI